MEYKYIKLHMVNGVVMTYTEAGTLISVMDEEGTALVYDLDHRGTDRIWSEIDNTDSSWEEFIEELPDISDLSHGLYLNNGQVIDEGRIVKITIGHMDGTYTEIGGCTGGADHSGWKGNENVYCESCETAYEVNIVTTDDRVPSYCCFCGNYGLLLREEE